MNMLLCSETIEDGWLKKLRITEIELLDEITGLCRKHSLQYSLAGGTLLGAVKYGGFIPWDDDIDIAMPRKDYEKFKRVSREGLGEKYELHSIETDNRYWLPFVKVRKKNTIFDEEKLAGLDVKKGIYVDIFPLDSTDDPSEVYAFQTKIIRLINIGLRDKIKMHDDKIIPKRYEKYRLLMSLCSSEMLHRLQDCIMKRSNKKTAGYLINYASKYDYEKVIFDIERCIPSGEIMFEGKAYSCPKDPDYVLKKMYGENYLTSSPSVKEQKTHKPLNIYFGED